ncbi:MAG TPA: indolepyruvate decarboxylase [Rheinheimera sp.]|uniref:thiamine pyrophosphate-binding protein n=1 Tax=Rheinheimera sp. TaxID=1869214 RepID=UPI000EE50D31|nr:thiamine pyrophosphate-binding protein [Rheinheimera sp.]HCU67095.1 indolepyruvate decarboxylase [Rheinheimera sp.]
MRLVDLLLQQLQQAGVQQIFGIPGDFVLPLFAELERAKKLPLYYVSHEPSAVFAADAAARFANQPSAVLLTYGAGALNAVNAVAQAYVEQVPLVIMAGFPSRAEIERDLHIHHQAKHLDSQRDIYREITCAQVRLDDIHTAAAELCRAIQTCQRESRPVLIEIPRDAACWPLAHAQVAQAIAALHCQQQGQDPLYQQELQLACDAMLKRLQQAKKPVLLCGIGIRRFAAVPLVEQLASRLNVPMLTTLLGRACVDQTHPQYAGVFVDRQDSAALALLADADLIIQLGVIQNDSNFAAHQEIFTPEKQLLIQQGELKMAGVIFHDLPIAALLQQLLQMPLPEFASRSLQPNSLRSAACGQADFTPQLAEASAQARTEADPQPAFNSASALTLIDQLLSQQTKLVPVVSDIGDCLFASLQVKPTYLLAPAYYASMGYAVPAALGVQAVSGLRPLVLVGDGAFQMTGLELGHCARYGFAPVVLLLNNSGWQMIKAFAPELSSTSLQGWNYSAIARGMGGGAYQVWSLSQLESAFEQALQDDKRFSLIEVMLPPGSSSARLQQFAAGFLSAQKQPAPLAGC